MLINFRIFTIRFIAQPQEGKSVHIIVPEGIPKKMAIVWQIWREATFLCEQGEFSHFEHTIEDKYQTENFIVLCVQPNRKVLPSKMHLDMHLTGRCIQHARCVAL